MIKRKLKVKTRGGIVKVPINYLNEVNFSDAEKLYCRGLNRLVTTPELLPVIVEKLWSIEKCMYKSRDGQMSHFQKAKNAKIPEITTSRLNISL